jgi:two-component system, NarL family, response regulator LiaR
MDNPIGALAPEPALTSKMVKVIIADDHPLMRDSIKFHLRDQPDIEIIAEAGNGEEAVKLAEELKPDLIIMDIAMPKMTGLEATVQIKAKHPNIAVLVLTVHNDTEYILKILEAGAAGYLTKDIFHEDLIHAIRAIISGESVLSDEIMKKLLYSKSHNLMKSVTHPSGVKLSAREEEIFKLAARGMNNKQICLQLNLNLRTVKWHLGNIFSKLNVSSRTEAVILGLKTGLLTLDDIN